MPQQNHRSGGPLGDASLGSRPGCLPDEQASFTGAGFDPAREALKVAPLTVLSVVIAVVLAGCAARSGPGQAKAPPPKPSPSASPVLAAPKQAALDKAMAAYTGYYRTYNAATADPSKSSEVSKYAGYPLRTEAGLWLRQMIDKGMVARGEPKISPTSTDVSDDARKVTITGCYDNNGTTIVIKKTGKNVTAPSQAQRYVTVAVVEPYEGGAWLVSKITPQRSTPC